MWACPFCISKTKQANCCGKIACEYSMARFSNITKYLEHLEAKHPDNHFTTSKETKDATTVL